MNKHLQFIIDNIDENERDYLVMKEGLIELHNIFLDSLVISPDLDYKEVYEIARDKLSDETYNALNPNGMSFGSMYGPRGGDFTVTVWVYFTTLLLDQNPSHYYVWEDFGEAMNGYMYDMESYMTQMYGDKKGRDAFPVIRLLNDFGGMDSLIKQEYIAKFLSSEGFLDYQAKIILDTQNYSLKQMLNQVQNLSSMRFEIWLEIAKSVGYFQECMKVRGTSLPSSIRSQYERLLLTRNTPDLKSMISSIVNGSISMLREDDDCDHTVESITNGMVMGFIKEHDEDLGKVIDAHLNPEKVSLPLGQDAVNLLLLTNVTKSEERPYYYEPYSVAFDIYDGHLDNDRDDYYTFARKVHNTLIPYFMAGYTGAIKEHGLILLD